MSEFSQNEIDQILEHGLALEDAERQLSFYREPPPFARLVRPCVPGDGLRVIDAAEADRLVAAFDELASRRRLMKFVPASGAASRMFKAPSSVLHQGAPVSRAALDDNAEIAAVLDGIRRFAFYDELAAVMAADSLDVDEVAAGDDVRVLFDYLLTSKGLDYAALPKALLTFHRYPDHCRTPFEEHLVEAAAYARDGSDRCRLHFTVSEEHRPLFERLADRVATKYASEHAVTYDLEYSLQKPSTDALAVGLDDAPFLEADGTMLFRPGGHGALIENLADLDADLVFVKNIDNLVPDHLRADTIRYKRVIGALLMELQDGIFEHLRALERDAAGDREADAALRFARSAIGIELPPAANEGSTADRIACARDLLDRPLRVCGMVRNTGEPGGGPFWVEKAGKASVQIVESSQVDPADAEQQGVLGAATHFNPVDLACSLRDHHGRRYDLSRYVDAEAVFIAEKSKDGRALKSLERPGLWNGAMAEWNTVFVEVPIETFNPVKTVNDLLRPQHQPPA